MSGSLLPTATSAAPNRSYYTAFGDGGGGGSASTINTEYINTSSIIINAVDPDINYALLVNNDVGEANALIEGNTTAELSLVSPGQTSLIITGDPGTVALTLGSGGVGPGKNRIDMFQDDANSNAGMYIVGRNDYSSYIQMAHTIASSPTVMRRDVVGSIGVGGAALASTMSIQLKDGDDNVLSGITLDQNGVNLSTIYVNSTSEYGLSIISPEGLAANAQIIGGPGASLSLGSGGTTSLTLQGEGQVYVNTGSAGVIEQNNVQIEQRDQVSLGKTTGMYILGHNEFSPYVQFQHNEEIGDEVYTTVRASVRVGGALYPSTMNIGLYDADNNPLAELGFRSTGLATNVMTAQNFTALNTGVGLGSVFYPGFNNANNPLDILQALPLARVLNSTGGDATCTSGINQFGRMTPGTIAQVIPTTTWSDASKVVLAPRTFIQLYTGSGGSGASVVYTNIDNSLFSTFTADPNMNTLAFNSYRFGFGN